MSNQENVNNALLPDGFECVKPEHSGAYFRYAPGSTIQGVLLGRFPKPGQNQDGFIYQIQITQAIEAFIKNPDEAAVKNGSDKYILSDVEAGTIVSIDEKSAIEGFKSLADDDKITWEVFVRVLEQKKLPNGRRYWDCMAGKKIYRGSMNIKSRQSEISEDAPF